MPKFRILVVDDAVVMRRLVTEVLQRHPDFEVVGTASNGKIALQRIEQLNPDLLTMDVEMPEMDGVQTLTELRKTHPALPVIMLSVMTQRGATATLDALAAGASDYVTKPSAVSNINESIQLLEKELVPKILAHCTRRPVIAAVQERTPVPFAAPRAPLANRPHEILCIATSTGGPNALTSFFDGLTAPIPVPVVIVQHMPPMFTGILAERLNARTPALRCVEAKEGEALQAGCAYLAPGGRHLAVERTVDGTFVSRLIDTPPENSCRPAADVLFRSVAETRAQALAVVMTGMGEDGLRGCQNLKEVSATILVQDEASSVVWGMPGAVARAGLAHRILPLASISAEVTKLLPKKALVLA